MKEKKELEEQFKKAQKPWSKLYEKVKLNHITIIQGVPINMGVMDEYEFVFVKN